MAAWAAGPGWVERVMPPAVTGAIVAAIGLNLAPIAVKGISASPTDTWIGLFTVLAVGAVAIYAPGGLRRLPGRFVAAWERESGRAA